MWYPDSGASSHITAASDNMQQPRLFLGNECILTANGSPLPIFGCGQSVVHSLTNKSFILCDLLHVLAASRNLLSIHRFCCDNNVILVFDSQRVQVKDLVTEDMLMEGRTNGSLYELPLQLNRDGEILLLSVALPPWAFKFKLHVCSS